MLMTWRRAWYVGLLSAAVFVCVTISAKKMIWSVSARGTDQSAADMTDIISRKADDINELRSICLSGQEGSPRHANLCRELRLLSARHERGRVIFTYFVRDKVPGAVTISLVWMPEDDCQSVAAGNHSPRDVYVALGGGWWRVETY